MNDRTFLPLTIARQAFTANPSLRSEIMGAFDNRSMSLFVLPTEKCNFRCTYCYEDFKIGQMPAYVVNGMKSLVEARAAELESLEVEWFGGEPLLAKPVILDVSRHITDVVSANPQLTYVGKMTTNGYLLDLSTAEALANAGVISYQISLDGPASLHDVSRVRADGAGTFHRIWSNLEAIKKSQLQLNIMLRLHFTPVSAPLLEPLIDKINTSFGGDTRFTVSFYPITRMGGPNDDSILEFAPGQIGRIQDWLENYTSLKNGPGTAEHARIAEPPSMICYAAKPNVFVIRANGDIGKCTVALYDERNTVGKLQEDGRIVIDNEKLYPWMGGFKSLDLDELSCPAAKILG